METNVSVSRLGDKSDHGGEIITATANAKIDGVAIAKAGDIHRCPIHGDTPISARSDMSTNDVPWAHIGAVAGCGAIITTGSDNLKAPLAGV
ncbi:PAAR domain-containing protein [Hydromonas duriensis]|uniref:Putative Zn-binding protein involved in type VI secretion n=1 Tax=Hydromonas duriensis TaxID=1527608 RepID=A0A4R6Y030_9BURK|nr:PAAR domain-containing protein [Hydromonas duriensis]TDR27730.1 putative Zn-binding protein involved in type VI secretion [Hydromonas duriensis]